jgi:hypothetical protein
MSQGQWKCVKKEASPPDEKEGDNSLLDDWNETAECMLERRQGAPVVHCPEGYDMCAEAEYLVGWVTQGDTDTLVDKGESGNLEDSYN